MPPSIVTASLTGYRCRGPQSRAALGTYLWTAKFKTWARVQRYKVGYWTDNSASVVRIETLFLASVVSPATVIFLAVFAAASALAERTISVSLLSPAILAGAAVTPL